MQQNNNLNLFEAFGIEIEYMIVDKGTLEIRPFADKLLLDLKNNPVNEVSYGDLDWSNELAMHVIEFKVAEPLPIQKVVSLENHFHENIQKANKILSTYNAMLLPGAMHPFWRPSEPVKLWPYGQSEVYKAYDKIFNCKDHGWVNLQSIHLNFPFHGDEQFVKLHSAIRFLLPILPALTASSPIVEGLLTGISDNRLVFYGQNQKHIPEISGDIIPESVGGISQYEENILNKMYTAISPFDKENLLQEEWLNSRGAIARFERSAIEIRVMDTQESALADIAICLIVIKLVKWLVSESSMFDKYHEFPQKDLVAIYKECIQKSDHAIIENNLYLEILGNPIIEPPDQAKKILLHFFHKLFSNQEKEQYNEFISEYAKNGSLASRIEKKVFLMKALTPEIDPKDILPGIYETLSKCLSENKIFCI